MDTTVAQVIDQITAVSPANVLLLAGFVILGLGLIPSSISGEAQRNLWGVLALVSLGVAAIFAVMQEASPSASANALFVADWVSERGVWLSLLGGLLIVFSVAFVVGVFCCFVAFTIQKFLV